MIESTGANGSRELGCDTGWTGGQYSREEYWGPMGGEQGNSVKSSDQADWIRTDGRTWSQPGMIVWMVKRTTKHQGNKVNIYYTVCLSDLLGCCIDLVNTGN
ncbi:hypothetical protein F2Q69_00027161 [Brassica cretica]|uniref:Uncharacterized protein n=1 Tax=Brassica cretica TaxID=69181 RepID=A0A8S9S3Y9_BRACR|nr:hypothetical protein F2Q69_00027161 [Brassica cretica]